MTYQTNVLTNMVLVGSAWRIWTAGVSKLHYFSIIPPKMTERACLLLEPQLEDGGDRLDGIAMIDRSINFIPVCLS